MLASSLAWLHVLLLWLSFLFGRRKISEEYVLYQARGSKKKRFRADLSENRELRSILVAQL
jgi:hypothetical protein